MTITLKLICARAAAVLLALVVLISWLSLIGGCSVDYQGLTDKPTQILARGEVDTGVTEVVTPESSDSGASESPPDGGAPNTPDVSPALDGSGIDSGNTAPPSECPISPNRSLSPCSATAQLCRYYDTGAPVLMVGCTAEGRLCVPSCN